MKNELAVAQLHRLAELKAKIQETEVEADRINDYLLTPELKERIGKFNAFLKGAEHDILLKLNHFVTCYDVLIKSCSYSTIEFVTTATDENDFSIDLGFEDRDGCTFTWRILLPFDPDRDEEYMQIQKNHIENHWKEEAKIEREKRLKSKKHELERLQKQIVEAESTLQE